MIEFQLCVIVNKYHCRGEGKNGGKTEKQSRHSTPSWVVLQQTFWVIVKFSRDFMTGLLQSPTSCHDHKTKRVLCLCFVLRSCPRSTPWRLSTTWANVWASGLVILCLWLQKCFSENLVDGRKLVTVDASSLPRMGIKDFQHIKVCQLFLCRIECNWVGTNKHTSWPTQTYYNTIDIYGGCLTGLEPGLCSRLHSTCPLAPGPPGGYDREYEGMEWVHCPWVAENWIDCFNIIWGQGICNIVESWMATTGISVIFSAKGTLPHKSTSPQGKMSQV